MMSKFFIVAIALALTACSISNDEIEKAEQLCADNRGLEQLHWSGPFSLDAHCNNGAVFAFFNREPTK
jgi:hypothetical protein